MSDFQNLISQIRRDFPILETKIYQNPLIYFDNAATTQKPKILLEEIQNYYLKANANTHSQHSLALELTQLVEKARDSIKKFLKADDSYELVFTKSATESLNLVAQGLEGNFSVGDNLLLTISEHHANLIPWQVLSRQKSLNLNFVEIAGESGEIDLTNYANSFKKQIKLVAFPHVSNVLGIINPVIEMTKTAQEKDSLVLVDGSQAVAHLEIDLSKIRPDFYVFSAHKVFGPTGLGFLIAKKIHLESLKPLLTGGDMVESVSLNSAVYKKSPWKFEAGTQNFEAITVFPKVLDYLTALRKNPEIEMHQERLEAKLRDGLKSTPGVQIIGQSSQRIPLISFSVKNINALDIATFLDLEGIAVRAGRHCADPLHAMLGLDSSLRASLCFYNTYEEIQTFIYSLNKIISKLS